VAPLLDEAQRYFYNGRYDATDALTLELCSPDVEGLAACELRSSTLLFQIKRAVSGQTDKQEALKACAPCAAWLASFRTVTCRHRRWLAPPEAAPNARKDEAPAREDRPEPVAAPGVLGRRQDGQYGRHKSLDAPGTFLTTSARVARVDRLHRDTAPGHAALGAGTRSGVERRGECRR
jgi:hypothetical protein